MQGIITESNELSIKLREPFDSDDTEWRVQRAGLYSNNTKAWLMAVCYVTNRAIQQRLDDVVGFGNWRNEYNQSIKDGFLCGLSIKIDGEWITKWDGAECTEIEPLKGGLSNSMKRSAVQWGIGRYLYNLDVGFASCEIINNRKDSKDNHHYFKKEKIDINWKPPLLPGWALPGAYVNDYSKNMKLSDSVSQLKEHFKRAYLYAKSFGRVDLSDRFKKEYDELKYKLELYAKDVAETEYKHVEEWLQQEINTLALIKESNSVDRLCRTFKDGLDKKVEDQFFNKKPLYEKLSLARQDRINEIKKEMDQ
ncbi:MAG: Rad52/Rad22 family DNA repair protein [Thiotrichaceae bacterium]